MPKRVKRIHKVYEVPLPLYHGQIKIVASSDFEHSWNRVVPFKSAHWENLEPETQIDLPTHVGFAWHYNHFGMIMISPQFLTHGLIGHECFHLANAFMNDIGHKVEQGQEPHAYLLEYLIDESHKAYKGFGFNIKKRIKFFEKEMPEIEPSIKFKPGKLKKRLTSLNSVLG